MATRANSKSEFEHSLIWEDTDKMRWCDLCLQHVYGLGLHLVEQHGFTLKAALLTSAEMEIK